MSDYLTYFQSYFDSIYYAFLAFPVLAAVITIPFLIFQYHRYGSVSLFRGVVVYSFILYLICMYFLIVLPLPSFADAAASTAPYTQLQPLNCFRDLLTIEGFSPRILSTYSLLIHNPDFWQIFFNVLLFVPLGIYLKYYFKKSWFITLLIAVAISLFFELTQLTALYGIYPRPYRMFDVDDLLLNTCGVMIGHIIAPLFTLFLPSREKIDKSARRKSVDISLLRRLLANLVDYGIVFLTASLLKTLFGMESFIAPQLSNLLLYLVLVFLYFILLPKIMGGRTIGKALVKIAIVTEKDTLPKFSQIAIRNGLLYGLILPSLFFAFQINAYSYTVKSSPFFTFLVGGFAIIFIASFAYYLWSWSKGKRQFLHEKWSHTKLTSTL